MNKIVNNFLLAGDKFMPEIHLKQLGFTYSACGPFNKNKERIQKFKQTGDTNYIYKNELDKSCFQHDMAYGDFKDLVRITASDKILRDKAFNNNNNKQNMQLAKIFHKPIIRNFKKRAVYSGFKDNVWGAYLADMQLISTFNKGFRFLFCVIMLFLVSMLDLFLQKIKKVRLLLMHFQKNLKNLIENRRKYGLIKEVNFTIIPLKNG